MKEIFRDPLVIGVLFGCFGGKIDGTGVPGGLIIYQGHLFLLTGHLCPLSCFGELSFPRVTWVPLQARARGLHGAPLSAQLRAAGLWQQVAGGPPCGSVCSRARFESLKKPTMCVSSGCWSSVHDSIACSSIPPAAQSDRSLEVAALFVLETFSDYYTFGLPQTRKACCTASLRPAAVMVKCGIPQLRNDQSS